MADPSDMAVRGAHPRHYTLVCPTCGRAEEDDGLRLHCIAPHEPSLLRTSYGERPFRPTPGESGLYRYREWLPVRRAVTGSVRTVTYRSEQLCRLTGLRGLWVAFHGYWPERGAEGGTGTFKDLEAYCVLGRLPRLDGDVLVVASAGNTAAAFADACSANATRCLIVVPESALGRLCFERPLWPGVRIVALNGDSDYSDAIWLADAVAATPGFQLEGGVKNVGRRDGLGTVMLNVYETLGRLPDFYVQAIGSGAGAIAVHEAARRLTGGAGPFPVLLLAQNLPFAPIHAAWRAGRREWTPLDADDARRRIAAMCAKVLSNRNPPWGVAGGLFDALAESRGRVAAVHNDEVAAAARLFEQSEQVDIEPAGAVALACLLAAARDGEIPEDALVVLNVTGAGSRRWAAEKPLVRATPALTLTRDEARAPAALHAVAGLFS